VQSFHLLLTNFKGCASISDVVDFVAGGKNGQRQPSD
jgi:hypothetical protein